LPNHYITLRRGRLFPFVARREDKAKRKNLLADSDEAKLLSLRTPLIG